MQNVSVNVRLAALLIVSFILFGCGSNVNKDERFKSSVVIEQSDMFVVLNPSVGERLVISNKAIRSSANLQTALVEVTNVFFKALKVQYRFAWYDVDGLELELESNAWKPTTIPENGVFTLKSTAPMTSAKYFKIFIR